MVGKALRVIQISDLHVFGEAGNSLLGIDTRESLEAIIEMVLRKEKDQVDLIILSGDLSHDGSAASYQYLIKQFHGFNVPIYAIPGNHDEIETFIRAFKQGPIRYRQVVMHQGWQFILLNSQKPGAVEGCLDASQLDFMQACLLNNPPLPTAIVFHHQPLLVNSAWLDQLGLMNAKLFWDKIRAYSQVKAVVFGHVHQAYFGKVGSVFCYAAPSTCIQFRPNLGNFTLEKNPPGYRWFNLYPDGRIETNVCRLPAYIGFFDKDATGY